MSISRKLRQAIIADYGKRRRRVTPLAARYVLTPYDKQCIIRAHIRYPKDSAMMISLELNINLADVEQTIAQYEADEDYKFAAFARVDEELAPKEPLTLQGKVIAMYADSKGAREIAKALHITPQEVHAIVKAHNES